MMGHQKHIQNKLFYATIDLGDKPRENHTLEGFQALLILILSI